MMMSARNTMIQKARLVRRAGSLLVRAFVLFRCFVAEPRISFTPCIVAGSILAAFVDDETRYDYDKHNYGYYN